jgi:hypothetical protein
MPPRKGRWQLTSGAIASLTIKENSLKPESMVNSARQWHRSLRGGMPLFPTSNYLQSLLELATPEVVLTS